MGTGGCLAHTRELVVLSKEEENPEQLSLSLREDRVTGKEAVGHHRGQTSVSLKSLFRTMSIFRFEQSYGLQAHIFTPNHKLIKFGPVRYLEQLTFF